MRIALVHDYLSQDGGAERVLAALHELWPSAPIFLLFHDREKITNFPQAEIHESFLSRLPFVKSCFEWYLPLMPLATERHNLKNFDVVVSSSSSFAKGVITSPETLHISYCHTPTRFLWGDTHEYLADLRSGWLVKLGLSGVIHRLRLWDKMSTDRVDHFVVNSRTVQQRLLKYYRRPSEVINPPVNVENFHPATTVGDYYVAGGRIVPYKRLDIVISAFNRLRWPLKIFGTSPELGTSREIDRLQRFARPNIEFLGQVSEREKADLLSHARAFIHPQAEDFGITPLEAMASGRPVIAYAAGGATETVIPGETGIFFRNQTWESLLDALLQFNYENWDSARLAEHAESYNANRFKDKMKQYVEHRWEEFQRGLRQPALIN